MYSCFGLQSYKIWVIYTTVDLATSSTKTLFWITKLQNLSDIHNCLGSYHSSLSVVLDYKVTKFEWYTQLALLHRQLLASCFGLQSYKIWVIYTTVSEYGTETFRLFWITKLQNLSDIHNFLRYLCPKCLVVLDYKVTKFEWYTQLAVASLFSACCCFGLQSYKIWVIYTTTKPSKVEIALLFWITKLQNLSDIHNG
mgnify:CR=1 FL=1